MVEKCCCRHLRIFSMIFGLATFWLAAPNSVSAQTLADVEIGGSGKEVHPTFYTYEGDIKPVYKDTVSYYTFFYTGLVEPNATVPRDTEILRIPISNLEWEQYKANMIQKLTNAFADAPNQNAQKAQKSIINRDVRLDKNFKYVDTKASEKEAAKASQRGGGVGDPEVAAEWAFYYDQFVLWQYYCRRVLLDQEDAELASSTTEDLDERRDREFLRKYAKEYDLEDLDVDEIIELVELERDEVEDEEREESGKGKRKGWGKGKDGGKFSRGSGKSGRNSKNNRDQDRKSNKSKRSSKKRGDKSKGRSSGGRDKIDLGDEGTIFEAGLDFEDPDRLTRYYDEFVDLAERREEHARRIYIAMVNDIEARNADRIRLADWKSQKENDLSEFVEAWDKVQSGERVAVGDTFYLITDKPVDSIPEESRNILVRKVLTPQDLMDENGELKESEYGQGF